MRRTPLPALLALSLLAGCGGGGKHSNTSSSGASVTFAANRIVYGVANGTGTDFAVDEVAPTGGTPTTVVADVDGGVVLLAIDPSQASRYALAADPSDAGTYGVYLSKNLAVSGATALVAPTYASVGSLALTPDGATAVYAATTTTGGADLFTVPTAGGTPSNLGAADEAAVSPDGTTVAYVAPPGGEGADALYTRGLASGAVTTLVADGTNHALPAFSPDGTRLAYWTLADGANALTVRTVATGATVTVPGVAAFEPQGVAFSPDGTTLAIVGQSGANGVIATVPADGSAAPTTILSSSSLLGNYGFFWTDANGRATAGVRSGLGASRVRRRS